MFLERYPTFVVISHVFGTISQHLLSYHMFLERYHNICCHLICFLNDITTFVVISQVFRTISQHLLSYHKFVERYHTICCHIIYF